MTHISFTFRETAYGPIINFFFIKKYNSKYLDTLRISNCDLVFLFAKLLYKCFKRYIPADRN